MKPQENNITLARYIKWVIGNRIMLCLGLLSIAVLITSTYDILDGFQQVKSSLNRECYSLSEFIVAQSLIDNQRSISVKLDELNHADRLKKYQWIEKQKIRKLPEIKWVYPLSWVYYYPVHGGDGEAYGELQISGSYFYYNSTLFQQMVKFSLLLIFSLLIFLLLYPLSKRIPQDLFISPVMNVLALLKDRSSVINDQNIVLPIELQEVHRKIIELMDEVTLHAREAALGQMAAQVAHDIRSPLTALDVVVKDIHTIPEEQRILIRNAASRIRDIANNLLSHHHKNLLSSHDEGGVENAPEWVVDLVSSVVSETCVQYRESGLNLFMEVQESAYSCFANISASAFKRVISNLLNNAIESMQDKLNKNIFVNLFSERDYLTVSIKDEGCGIPPSLLEKLNKGETVSHKKKGHGLGLSYAIRMIDKSWGGKIVIDSEVGAGTTVEVILPKMRSPEWFASRLLFSSTTTIVVLDDDETIHQVWNDRLKSYKPVAIFKFHTVGELLTWFHQRPSDDVIYLIDYELIESAVTGLSVIEQLNIAASSFLVTSRYEEENIREKCIQLGLRLLPKNFAPHIPVQVIEKLQEQPELIFIDDSVLMTQAWLMRAKLIGKNIITFNTAEDFMHSHMVNVYSKNIPIYIDSDLGAGVTGQDVAKILFEDGFSDIYLATGFHPSVFGEMGWIRSVVSKEPPF
ncbi:MAG: HAMP domain-containing sensor histidine kinase [Gammaproteobacteria bacterium]|nr:HAMP domain-containing sensor histidine kinase [Gammaproteobacteria bacterium]